MRTLFTLTLMMVTISMFGQHIVVNTDSTELLFPNKVSIPLGTDLKAKQFSLSRKSLRVLLAQTNYLYDRMTLLSENAELSSKEVHVRDSIIAVLKQANNYSDERVGVYADAYGKSKLISEEYDEQINSLIADVSRLQAASRRSKRKSFVRGVFAGVAVGAVSIILLTSIQ